MRRLFIIRKDLDLTPGKMGAMAGHLCEAYWTNLLKRSMKYDADPDCDWAEDENRVATVPRRVWDEYVEGIFTKTFCEAKNLVQLKKAEELAKAEGLVEGEDWGYIRDCCKTELKPENPDGTCTVGVWFAPLPDETVHAISKKFKLYGAFDRKRNCDIYRDYDSARAAYVASHPVTDQNSDLMKWLFEPYQA